VKKLLALVLVAAALAAGFAYVNSTEPAWYGRLRYPLHYDSIVRGHARNYRLDPALLAGVIYQESKFHAHARSSSGAIAEIVFADREALDWLEGLLHPLVVDEYMSWRERLAELDDPPRVSATEVPLLYEVGGEDRFDAVVVVTAPPKVRAGRSEVAAEQREPRLLPDPVKIAQADFAYVNDGSLEKLDDFVQAVLRELMR